jgi:hypothetical protein
MTCDALTHELVGFHLGALDPLARDAIDAHLLECRGCLGRYLATKRALEDGQLPDEAPSPALRARVRADVAALVVPAPAPVTRLRPAWVVGLAAAAAVIFLFAFELGSGRFQSRAPAPSSAQAPLIDSEQADTSLKVL